MSAEIIAFPGRARRHSQDTIESAQQVRAIAVAVFEQNDFRHRIEAFEKAIKTLSRGRATLRSYISVFNADPYELAVQGPA